MPSIFDLMPASLWPVQRFIPPPNPAQPTAWSSAGPGWSPGLAPPPPSWPTGPVDAAPYADASVSDWDRAMRQALAAQAAARPDPGAADAAFSEQMLAYAKRAHDFARWAFGPPTAPAVQPISDLQPGGASSYVGGAPRDMVAASGAAPFSPVPAPAADAADVLPPVASFLPGMPPPGPLAGTSPATAGPQPVVSAADQSGILGPALAHLAAAVDQPPAVQPLAGSASQVAPAGAGDGFVPRALALGSAAIRPITTYPATQRRFAQDGLDLMGEGWRDITAGGDDTAAARRYAGSDDQAVQAALQHGYGRIPEIARGVARMGMGAVGWIGSPVDAALHNLLGEPVENVTGIPSQYTDFTAALALPWLKRLPGMSAPPVGAVRVLHATPSAAADTASPVEPVAGEDGGPATAADQASSTVGPASTQAAPTSVLDGANYSQRGYRPRFSKRGDFKGRKINDVADDLRFGRLTPADVPVQYIVREGNTLIMNTRSSQALTRAGISRSRWQAVNVTGDPDWERRLNQNLRRNRLTSSGTPTVEEEPEADEE